ncbi:MAG: P-loop NTPase [Proteobacteria bacterium]|nr:P-loop NTPase [Pseudomonadota bacterium]
MSVIWAIGGGKGGTGKSLVVSSLAMHLARAENTALLVDADLGTANLHTFLGLEFPPATLSDFVSRRQTRLKDIVLRTGVPNLSLISGARDTMDIANLKYAQKMKILRHLRHQDQAYVLLDLGSGTSYNVLDFFLAAGKGIFVASPEPTSIENTYRFIKGFFYRAVNRSIKNQNAQALVEEIFDREDPARLSQPIKLLAAIQAADNSVAEGIREELSTVSMHLIINQTRVEADRQLGRYMSSACHKYFTLEVEYVGHVPYDDRVWQSIRQRRPFLQNYPLSPAARALSGICEKLMDRRQFDLDWPSRPQEAAS